MAGAAIPYWLIGGIAGGLVSVIQISARRGKYQKVLAALSQGGPAAARAQLDKSFPPQPTITANQILNTRERMALLTILNDVNTLQLEIAGTSGKPTMVAQVTSMGMIGIALRTAGPVRADALAKLDDMTNAIDRDSGRLMALVKKQLHALVALGRGIQGAALASDQLATLSTLAAQKNAAGVVISQALIPGLIATGLAAQAEECRRRVLAATNAFVV